MDTASCLPGLGDNSIVAFGNTPYKVVTLKKAFSNVFVDNNRVSGSISDELRSALGMSFDYSWFNQGVNCDILSPGYQDWQKGKIMIKVSIEFYPDKPVFEPSTVTSQPESSLDDIRCILPQPST